ncbi:MAG: acyl-CoA dehydrogenase family protein [Desulfobacterales bacterium]|nr:acyl-CoA dehydrogenase family protein [Desulfobacterales bacterium]
MSTQPTQTNPYDFNPFLQWRQAVDYYRDDPFIQQVLRCYAGDRWDTAHQAALEISPRASFRWRDMADAIAVPEKRPYMMHYDGHNHRIDRIVRPHETEVMEKEVFAEALFSEKTDPWVKLIKMFLIYQNGEACISCPLTCTEGLVAIVEKFADTPELERILQHCKEGIDGEVAIGAQYLSEIQGGSDVPANILEAVNEDGTWRLYGTKFFCSATHADYAIVTALPKGEEKVAVFVVPSWLPGNKEREIRNGFTIDRIKWKMGTSELTTGELTFNGAEAYPVGPMDRGVANVVGIVLTCSRLTVGLSGAAGMTRSVREAKKYSQFREAFGMPIERFPLVAGQIRDMERAARRTTAGAFKLYRDFLNLAGGLQGGLATDENESEKRHRFMIRELVMLQKITTSWDAVDVSRAAMSIFGGHGVMEDFSCLPRLYRDAAVNELWEGPRNVLLTQIYRDILRVKDGYLPATLVADMLAGADPAIVDALGLEMAELVAFENPLGLDDAAINFWKQWDGYCHRLFHAYQDLALAEVEAL